MRKIAISTGIFEKENLHYLIKKNINCVEIGCHNPEELDKIIKKIKEEKIEIIGIHGPIPNILGKHPNFGSKKLEENYKLIYDSFKIASEIGAKYVTFHPFYVNLPSNLPTKDKNKFNFLRRLNKRYNSLEDYIKSKDYINTKELTIKNLKNILQKLDKDFPNNILLCLENLGPRIGYGLQIPSEFLEIYEKVNSKRLKLDLDLPHAHLSSNVYSFSLTEEIKKIRNYITSSSINQNHGGIYSVDRLYTELIGRSDIQDVDPHFPIHGKTKIIKQFQKKDIFPENLGFINILKGVVEFNESGELNTGNIPINECLKLINPDTNIILEYDNHYAPMQQLINSYTLFQEELK